MLFDTSRNLKKLSLKRTRKKTADNFAITKGTGTNNLFLLINFNNRSKISLKEITSGPIHSKVRELIFLEIA